MAVAAYKKLTPLCPFLKFHTHLVENYQDHFKMFLTSVQGYYVRCDAWLNISKVNWFPRLVTCLSEFLLNDYRNNPNTVRLPNYRRRPWNERIPKRTVRLFAKLLIAHIMLFQWKYQISYKTTLEHKAKSQPRSQSPFPSLDRTTLKPKSNSAFRYQTAPQSLRAAGLFAR